MKVLTGREKIQLFIDFEEAKGQAIPFTKQYFSTRCISIFNCTRHNVKVRTINKKFCYAH